MAGKVSLALRLAEATGRSLAEAQRFVTNVGAKKADEALRAVENGISWKLPTLAGIGTGGALYWREQDLRQARAIAEKAESDANEEETALTMLELLLSEEGQDLPADLQRKMLEGLANDGEEADEEDDDSGSGLPDLLGLDGASIQQTVILLVVVLVVLNWALARTSTIGMPTVGVQR